MNPQSIEEVLRQQGASSKLIERLRRDSIYAGRIVKAMRFAAKHPKLWCYSKEQSDSSGEHSCDLFLQGP